MTGRSHNRDIFSVKNEDGLAALPGWLQQRSYNTWNAGSKDRFGNPIVGLGYEASPDHDWSDFKRRGLIVINSAALRGKVIDIVRENAQ